MHSINGRKNKLKELKMSTLLTGTVKVHNTVVTGSLSTFANCDLCKIIFCHLNRHNNKNRHLT